LAKVGGECGNPLLEMANHSMHQSTHQKIEALLLDHGERDEPIAFAGRENIPSSIQRVVGRLAVKPRRGQTFVIEGAPGAGKTSLISELANRLRGDIPCIVRRNVPDENGVEALWNELAATLTAMPLDKIRAIQHKRRFGEGGLNAIVKAQVGYEEGKTMAPMSLSSCDQIRGLTEAPFKTAVVVCIDEIQNIQSMSGASGFVQDLHTQDVAPVLLICSGLSNSTERLDDIGISRSTQQHLASLGSLMSSETYDAALRALNVIAGTGVHVKAQTLEVLAQRLVSASDHWPRHLTCYLQGVCNALLEQDTPSFERLDQDAVIKKGDDLRRAYYQERLRASRLSASILARAYRDIERGEMDPHSCAARIFDWIQEERSEQGAFLRELFPSRVSVLDRMLRSGVIATCEDVCEIPVPSMAAFVYERAREESVRNA